MRPFFKDETFNFQTEVTLGATYHQAADVGEVLATVERIRNGQAQSWVDEWSATADRLAGEATASAEAGRSHSAAHQFLRVSMYYSVASNVADGTGDPTLFARLWEKHRAAWDRFVDLTDLQIEQIEIPYEGTTLPGYFFRSGPAGEPRRTLIYNNGSDGPVTGAWVQGVADALDRGWNAVTFDGPGQNAALVRQGIPFRPDWEAVLTPLIDHLATRPDIDPARIAVLGLSQGGFWVPRAVAYEHRVAAAVADPGVIDVSTTMLRHLPGFLRKALDAGDRDKFDQEMGWGLKFSAGERTMLAWRMRPYGVTSYFDFFTAAEQYRLTESDLAAIRCPMLITDPEHEQFWPGQPARLADALTSPVTLLPFTAAEGADGHCEPLAAGLRGERIFDWLDQQVPA